MNIGLDIGYSSTKAISADTRFTFPSVVGTPDRARFGLGNSNSIFLLKPFAAQIGEGAVLQSRAIKRKEERAWIESDEWYALFLAALSEFTTATHADFRIVTGLPVAFYSDRGALKERIMGDHQLQREDRRSQTLTVSGVNVIPQPFGALLSACLDNKGRIVNSGLATSTVGVIDVGGKTTNILSVNKLSEISRETASVNVGMWDAIRALREYFNDNYPGLDELRDHQVVDAVVNGYVNYYGECVDLKDVLDGLLEPFAAQIISETGHLWNGGATLDSILVTGGGALLLGQYLTRHFRQARIVEDAVYANAIGFWRFAERLAGGA